MFHTFILKTYSLIVHFVVIQAQGNGPEKSLNTVGYSSLINYFIFLPQRNCGLCGTVLKNNSGKS